MNPLKSISISGYKSIGSEQRIAFGDASVLLGANGAGKSNLISFFKLLNFMMTGALQNYIGQNGYSSSLLHFGPRKTQFISAKMEFSSEDGLWTNEYELNLSYAMPDSLFVSGEHLTGTKKGEAKPIEVYVKSSDMRESGLAAEPAETFNTAQKRLMDTIRYLLGSCRVFQFHNTSDTAELRNSCYMGNNSKLMSNAGNLPAFLYAMKRNYPKHYRRIVENIRLMVPQFRDFVLEPDALNRNNIMLNWIGERGSDYVFGPHQLSDGSLRYIALTTLLLQPKESIPKVIILDEPELGLHPSAVRELAGMISMAKRYSQIILAAQSPDLANLFDAEDITIVNYDSEKNESHFTRLDPDALKDWLEDYTIADLWEKNVIGGRP